MDHSEVGKAYTAYLAFNWKQRDLLKDFNLKRWQKVVQAIEGKRFNSRGPNKPKPGSKKWSSVQRAKFNQAILERKNGLA